MNTLRHTLHQPPWDGGCPVIKGKRNRDLAIRNIQAVLLRQPVLPYE